MPGGLCKKDCAAAASQESSTAPLLVDWLPVAAHIRFKIMVLAYKAVNEASYPSCPCRILGRISKPSNYGALRNVLTFMPYQHDTLLFYFLLTNVRTVSCFGQKLNAPNVKRKCKNVGAQQKCEIRSMAVPQIRSPKLSLNFWAAQSNPNTFSISLMTSVDVSLYETCNT